MLFFLSTFVLCELKISDVNIRLPIYCDKEGSFPYQYITCYNPNAEFKIYSQSLIDIEYIERNSYAIVVKVIVKYKGPEPVATEINVTNGNESVKITVNIDRIDHLQILSTSNSLYVDAIIPIKIKAFNEKGLIFSSLNGTNFQWGSTSDSDCFFDFIKIEDSPLRGRFDPSHYILIRPKKAAEVNITCKLIYRDAIMGNQKFIFIDKIMFHSRNIYMLKKTEIDVHLYYGFVGNYTEFHPNLNRPIDYLTNITIKSYNPLIANVSLTGRISAFELGETTIVARDKYILSNSCNTIVHVVIPNGASWEEQWIKTIDRNKELDSIGPFAPNTSTIILYYDDHIITVPDNLHIELSDEWKRVGTHSVNVSFPDAEFNFIGIVHTCLPPIVNPSQVNIPVGYKNYQFNILGGSGDFYFVYDNSLLIIDDDNYKPQIEELENGTILSIHSLSSLKEGRTVIMIYDKKFKGYNTTLTIVFDKQIDETNFANSNKAAYVAVLATDSDSINKPECNLIMSHIIDSEEKIKDLPEVYIARIPYNHHIKLNLFSFSKNGKRLGIYSEPNAEIILTTSKNEKIMYSGSFQVIEDLNATVRIKNKLATNHLKIEVIHPHKTREPNPISIYQKNNEGEFAHIIHGNGPFEVIGKNIELFNDRTLYIKSSLELSHTAFIIDRCIPENNYSIYIKTFSCDSLEIIGPTHAISGEHLQFQAIPITQNGKIIPPEFNDQIKWSSETSNLYYNKSTGFWEITTTKPGKLEIIIVADNIRKTHTVNVLEKVAPKYEYLTMFVGEKIPLEFNGNIEKDTIKVKSNDIEVVSIEENLVAVAHKPGMIQATVYSKFENSIITIHVIEAKKLILKCNKTNLQTGDPVYVGSYVHIVPYIETDIGIFPPKTVSWIVDGNYNYEILYDNSIVVKGEKEGTVVVTASSINNLINNTMIYFDYQLQLQNKEHINIPLGSTYDIKIVDENMTNITYKIIAESNQQNNNRVTINKDGQIYAGAEGQYIVIIRYKSQWQVIPLSITTPSKLILYPESSNTIHPRVLDPDYREYTPFNNYTITFDPSLKWTKNNGFYTFEILGNNNNKPIQIKSNVAIYHDLKSPPLWDVHNSVILSSNNCIPKGKIIHALISQIMNNPICIKMEYLQKSKEGIAILVSIIIIIATLLFIILKNLIYKEKNNIQ